VPAADADAVVATLFTSGSTGAPQPQAKTWRSLARTAELDSLRFAMQQALNLVSTVPAQHMFGLQTAVMLPFMSRCALHDSQPFFPADIRAALESLPAPRALILTPPHLRACVAARLELPELSFILSATAPLTLRLAQQAETLWHTQVLEIYGSTEAGTIATRRSTASELWRLVPGSTLQVTGGETLFHVAHLPEPLRLSDHVEPAGDHEFRLRGRASDQIKVAGKRASLGELTHTLLQIPGIRDAVVFLPETATRTAALVVAPGLNKAEILDLLSQRMDPVFLPRPLIMLKQLPRNEVGKLTQAALGGAIAAHQAGAERAS
jgi:acyl-coenzyme A synthetase/AMP-(fatty) acid ligase